MIADNCYYHYDSTPGRLTSQSTNIIGKSGRIFFIKGRYRKTNILNRLCAFLRRYNHFFQNRCGCNRTNTSTIITAITAETLNGLLSFKIFTLIIISSLSFNSISTPIQTLYLWYELISYAILVKL